jgi:hypothetical protein
MMMIIVIIMIMTMRGGSGGVGPCLFPSNGDALDANESLSAKGVLFSYSLAETEGAGVHDCCLTRTKPHKTSDSDWFH